MCMFNVSGFGIGEGDVSYRFKHDVKAGLSLRWVHMGSFVFVMHSCSISMNLSIYLSLLSRSISDHHLRCGGWLNLEFSKREKHSGWAIKTIYKK